MPKNMQEEKYRWIKLILAKEIIIKDVSKICPFSESTLKYWLDSYRSYGIGGLKPRYTRPKSNPKKTHIRIKERIIANEK
ncbi:MAG: helix-turn-helix domain-containing protein [Candidatus Nealsonbacteria bacterium]